MTTPSHASIFTGVNPYVHRAGVYREGFQLREGWSSLAEILAAKGYRTGARTEGVGVAGDLGFSRGFQSYSDGPSPKSHARFIVGETFADAGQWLRQHASLPFFFFAHTYQIHTPYSMPQEFAARFVDPAYTGWEKSQPSEAQTAPERADASNRYDAGIAYTDATLGRFFEGLKQAGLYDTTWIVLFSDHGEEFWEHGGTGHARTLYSEVTHVPVIIRPPGGVTGGRRIAQPILSSDLFATVLAITGTPMPPDRDSVNLLPLAANAGPYGRQEIFAYFNGYEEPYNPAESPSEWDVFRLRTPEYTYVRTTPLAGASPAAREEIFAAADRAEAANVAEAQPGWRDAARAAVEAWRAAGDAYRKAGPQAGAAMPEERLEALKAMGYLH